MKCPKCGAWNTAYLPRCKGCGMPLTGNIQKEASWEQAMHKKKPSLTVVQYDPDVPDNDILDPENKAFDPDALNTAALTDVMEQLKIRRQKGADRINQMKSQAARVRQSVRETQIIRPVPEAGETSFDSDSVSMRRRQQRQAQYTENLYDADDPFNAPDSGNQNW